MPSKILIVDGMAVDRTAMRVTLASAYYDVVQAGSGTEALSMIKRENPDLVMVSANLPDMPVETFCRKAKATETGQDRPVLLTLPPCKQSALIAGLDCGADQVLLHPYSDRLLFAQLRALIRSRSSTEEMFLQDKSSRALGFGDPPATFLAPWHIGIVADNPRLARRWQSRLRLPSQHKLSNHTPRSLMRDIETKGPPDILVIGIDDDCPESGLSLLAGLTAQPDMRRTMFLAVIEGGNDTYAATALDLGASDLMMNGFGSKEATLRLIRLAQRKHLADTLHRTVRNGLRAAMIDPLTGLHNRRYALPRLGKMTDEAAGANHTLAVMLADIDHFKQINDRHGHAIGDEVLRCIADRLSAKLPVTALLARIGGEEFLIAIPAIPLREARLTACALCDAIGNTPINLPGAPAPLSVTISIGLSLAGGPSLQAPASATQLLEQADQALYGAKSDGRNQVMLSRPAA